MLVSLLRRFLRPFGGKAGLARRHSRGMTPTKIDGDRVAFDERVDVSAWRLRRLLESNFAPALALQLATTPGIDLHALLDLVARGCAPDLAARILDPFVDPFTEPGMAPWQR